MGRVPFGYLRPSRKLEVDPIKGPAVTEAYAMRASGATWTAISTYIKEATGVHQPPNALRRMLSNPTYLGQVRSGSDLVCHDAHTALVDQATFDAVQAAPQLRPYRKHESLLAGLMTCASCGQRMTFHMLKMKNGQPYPTYYCQRHSSHGVCPAPVTISARAADEAVTDSFRAWSRQQPSAVGDPADVVELAEAEDAVAAAEGELTAWVSSPISSALDEAVYVAATADRQNAVDAARDRLRQLRAAKRVTQLAVDADAMWDDLTNSQRRTFIASAVDRITVHPTTRRGPSKFDDRATIAWRKA